MKTSSWNTHVPVLFAFALVLAGCDAKKNGESNSAKATKAGPVEATSSAPAKTAAEAARPALAAISGVPAAPTLGPLAKPGGPEAEGNVAKDVEAAMGAKDCKIEEGELVDCGAVDAYGALQNNWVVAKPPARAKTMLNLLGSAEPQVRMLVLSEHPLDFIRMFVEEQAAVAATYEPYFSAALAESHPAVRSGFAWDIRHDEVLEAHPQFVPVVAAIGERYSAAEDGEQLIAVLSEAGNGEEDPAIRDALLGIAARNPDANMRAEALRVVAGWEGKAPVCELALAALGTDDEARERGVVELLVGDEPDCATARDAWLELFVPRAKAGTLSQAWLEALYDWSSSDAGAKRVNELQELGTSLAAVVPEDHDLRNSVDQLVELGS